MSEPERLTMRQAARILDVSLPTLRRMIARGQLPGEMRPGPFGERWEVPRDALARFQARREAGEVAEIPPHETPGVTETTETGGEAPQDLSDEVAEAPGAEVPEAVEVGGEAPRGSQVEMAEAPPGEVPEVAEAGGDAPRGEAPEAGEVPGLLTLHARALEVAGKALDRARALEERLQESQERAARAERHAEELRYALTQHQRALTEAAESLAEERARALMAEQAMAQAAEVITLPAPETTSSRLAASTPRSGGWGSRLRRWLWGERAG